MNMTVFDIMLIPDKPIKEIAKLARLVDEGGFDTLWIADESPVPNFRDPFTVLTAAALNTKNVKLGTGIAIPYHYHPVLMAVAISSLVEATEGRITVGLGPGGTMPLRPLGLKVWDRPVTALQELEA